MEKVVYILGAGFSAPLGLPVMSNFLEKSKDQYFKEQGQFKHFLRIFEIIDKMGKIKTYYKTDLLNIEEILSILEMQESFGDKNLERSFIKYITDVIEFYTPKFGSVSSDRSWVERILGQGEWLPYGYFVAALLKQSFSIRFNEFQSLNYSIEQYGDNVLYSGISLNYDLILESMAEYIDRLIQSHKRFIRGFEIDENLNGTPLAKLHGSIDTNDIVPPTWNKVLNQNILEEWRLAFRLLTEANHIRILGYSLPPTDTYIKYLLRAAIIGNSHLKRIDVLCLDQDGTVKQRYGEFIDYKNYRFKSASIEDYLTSHEQIATSSDGVMRFNQLEIAHSRFFESY